MLRLNHGFTGKFGESEKNDLSFQKSRVNSIQGPPMSDAADEETPETSDGVFEAECLHAELEVVKEMRRFITSRLSPAPDGDEDGDGSPAERRRSLAPRVRQAEDMAVIAAFGRIERFARRGEEVRMPVKIQAPGRDGKGR
jgi:hypothetical protein